MAIRDAQAEAEEIDLDQACSLINAHGIREIVHHNACEEVLLKNGGELCIWHSDEHGVVWTLGPMLAA